MASTNYRYNELNQKVQERRPFVTVVRDGVRTFERPLETWGYDSFGRLTQHIDANQAVTTTVYDSFGRVRERRDAMDVRTLFVYDTLGRERLSEFEGTAAAVGQTTPFEQNIVAFKEYDHSDALTQSGSLNRLIQGGARQRWTETTYLVNARGHRLRASGSDRAEVAYTVDSQGRVLQRIEGGATYSTTYNTLGLKTLDGDALGSDTWQYDVFGREVLRTDRGGRSVHSVYGLGSGIKTSESASAPSDGINPAQSGNRSFTYHLNGLLHTVTDVTTRGNDSTTTATTYSYNERGLRTVEDVSVVGAPLGSVGESTTHQQQTQTTYDAVGRIATVSQVEDNKVLFSASYGYDAMGNRTEVRSRSSMTGIQNQGVVLITTPPDQYLRIGKTTTFAVSIAQYFRDSDGDPIKLTYRLLNQAGGTIQRPDWLTISPTPSGDLIFVAANPIAGQSLRVELTAESLAGDRTPVTTSFMLLPRSNSAPELIDPANPVHVVVRREGQPIDFGLNTLAYFSERDSGDQIVEALLPEIPMPKGGLTFSIRQAASDPRRLEFTGTMREGTYEFAIRVVDQGGLVSDPLTVRFVVHRDDPVQPRQPSAGANVLAGGFFDRTFAMSNIFTDDGKSALQLLNATLSKPSWLNYSFDNVTNPTTVRFFGMAPANAVIGDSFFVPITVQDANLVPVTGGVNFIFRQNQVPHRVGPTSLTLGSATSDQYFISDRFRLWDYFDDADWDALTLEVRHIAGSLSSFPGLQARVVDGQFEIFGAIPPTVNGFAGVFELVAFDGMHYSAPVTLNLNVIGGGAAAGAANSGPLRNGTMPERTLYIGVPGQSFSVGPYFRDPEGDDISFRYGKRHLEDGEFDMGSELDWLLIDPDTGRFTVVPTAGMGLGHVNIRVEPSSLGGTLVGGTTANPATDFRINLVYPPAGFAPVAPADVSLPSASVGVPYSFVLPTFGAHEPVQLSLTGLPPGMTFDEQERRIHGTSNAAWTGTLTYSATKDGQSTHLPVPFSVYGLPTLGSGIPTQSVAQNQRWNYTIPAGAFLDPNGDSVVRAFVIQDQGGTPVQRSLHEFGFTFDVATQSFRGTALVQGTHRIGLDVRNGLGVSQTFEFSLQVGAPVANIPPLFSKVGITYDAVLNEAISPKTLATASDETPSSLRYRVVGLPAGFSFNETSRQLTGTPQTYGVHRFELWARDEAGQTDKRVYDIDVNDRPTPPNFTLPSGTPTLAYDFILPAFTDQNGVPTHGLTGTLPQGLSFNDTTRRLSGTPQAGTTGSWVLTYSGTDGRGLSKSMSLTLVIGSALNNAPVPPSGTISPPVGQKGSTYTFTLPAFTDPDGDSLTYTLDSALPGGLSLSGLTITGTPNASWNGTVTYRATDTKGAWATKSFSMSVNSPPVSPAGTITAPVGVVGIGYPEFILPAFTDADGDGLIYSMVTPLPPGLSLAALGNRQIIGTPTARWSGDVTYRATDPKGGSSTKTFFMSVNDRPTPPPGPTLPDATVSVVYSAQLPAFADLDGIASTSLSGHPSGLTYNASTRTLSGTPSANAAGTYTLTYGATDSLGLSNSIQISFVVRSPANRGPVVSGSIPNATITAGTAPYSQTIPSNLFTDPDGDAITIYDVTGLPPGITRSGNTISGTPTTAGTYNVSVWGRDPAGLAASYTYTITVRPWHQQPVPGPAIPDQYSPANQAWYYTLPANAIVDPEGQPIAYTASYVITQVSPGVWDWISLSSIGLNFDPGSRAYSGWPPIGRHHIVVLGRDQEFFANTTFFLDVYQGGGGGGGGGGGEVQLAQPAMMSMDAQGGDDMALSMEAESTVGQETPPASAFIIPDHILAQFTSAEPTSEAVAMSAMAAPEDGPSTAGLQEAVLETIRYDALGRMVERSGGSYDRNVLYGYDRAGHLTSETTLAIVDGQMQTASHSRYVVDTRGRRVAAYGNHEGQEWLKTTWHYFADDAAVGSAGKLQAEVTYFPPSSSLTVLDPEDIDSAVPRSIAGWVNTATTYTYGDPTSGATGRLLTQTQWARPAINTQLRGEPGFQVRFYPESELRRFLALGDSVADNDTLLAFRSGAVQDAQMQVHPGQPATRLVAISQLRNTAYNASGNVTQHSVQSIAAGYRTGGASTSETYTHNFTTQWRGFAGGWVEGKVTGTGENFPTRWLDTEIDAFGRVTSREEFTQVDGQNNNQWRRGEMHYNADGQVVLRREYTKFGDGDWTFGNPDNATAPKPNTRYVYSNGQSLAELNEVLGGFSTLGWGSERGPAQLVANGVAGADGPYRAGGSSVVVQPGDTLVSLSQRVYGSGSYWYVLAEANGYSGADVMPPAGLSLRVPSIDVSRNDATSFRPFNPAETLGPNVPQMGYVAPGSNGCEQVAKQIVVVVIAAVVTYYLGPYLGAKVGSTFLGYAAAGAVGSVASQTAGMAMGLQNGLDWKQVGIGALTAGATGGVGGNPWVDVAKGVARDALVGKLQGDSFSWRSVAASVIGNFAGQKIGGALGKNAGTSLGQAASHLVGGLAGGMVSEHAKKAWGTSEKINYTAVAISAVSSTLTGALTGQHAARAAEVRRSASGVNELLNWKPSNEAPAAPKDWGVFDPNGRYGARAGMSLDALNAPEGGWRVGPSTYTVRRGDTLSRIAKSTYGDELLWAGVAAANGINDPRSLMPGTVLTLPMQDDINAGMARSASMAHNGWDVQNQAAIKAQRTADVAAARARKFRFFETAPAASGPGVGGAGSAMSPVPSMSRLQMDAQSREAWKAGNKAYYEGFAGSVLGDTAMYAGLYASDAGVAITGVFQTVGAMFTDGQSRQQMADGITYAVTNPGKVYDGIVTGVVDFAMAPIEEQARSVGSAGFEFIATAGTAQLVGKTVKGVATSSANVANKFARYGGEAQRSALLAEVQQAATLSEKIGVVARSRLQRLTDTQNSALAANPRIAQVVLSPAEYLAATREPWLANMQYGNAVERLVAREAANTPRIDRWIEHVGGPNKPDFVGKGRLNGMTFDITTEAARAAHMRRPYGPGLNIIPYQRPADFITFPR